MANEITDLEARVVENERVIKLIIACLLRFTDSTRERHPAVQRLLTDLEMKY